MPETILSVQDLSKSFGVELIFSGVTFQIQERDRIALVGINGAGKSTLLRIVAGLEHSDAGSVVAQSGLRTAYQAQEARFDERQTLREAALDAFREVRRIGEELAEIEQRMGQTAGADMETLFERYADLTARFDAAHGYDIEHRTDQVLAGLGFGEEDYLIPVAQLSGGQKTRLALAHALLIDPDLLLLDEPTNHLDLAALEWLENFLTVLEPGLSGDFARPFLSGSCHPAHTRPQLRHARRLPGQLFSLSQASRRAHGPAAG